MFRQIKFLLLAVVLITGISSCSSDDNKPEALPEGKEYTVTVTVTEDASIHQIMSVIYEGQTVKNDVINDLDEKEWTKVYRKTDTEKISFTAKGLGQAENSRMEIKIHSEGEVIGEAFALGKALICTVVIQPETNGKKDKKGTL